MSKTYVITLGGVTYTCHPFNLGELEHIAELTDSIKPSKAGFAILKLALARALPTVPDASLIEATAEELQVAIKAVMDGSGMQAGEARPATAA